MRLNNIFYLISIILLCLSCNTRDDTMRISSWVSSPIETELFEQVLNDFRKNNPDIEFKHEPIPGSYSEKLQLMLGTNTAPDIFYLKGLVAPSYMSFDVLQPLNEYIEADTNFHLDDFYPFLQEAFKKEDTYYGIAKDFNPYVLFYNKTMFEEAGLDTVPKNWAELKSFAKKLTKDTDGDGKIDQYGFMVEPSIEMVMPFVYQNGGTFQNDDGSIGVTDDKFIEAVEFYHSLHTDKVAAMPSDLGTTWNGDAFGRKKVAMIVSGGWAIPFLQQNFPEVEYGVAHLPQGKKKATVAFTTAFCMSKTVKEKEAAWKLYQYITGKEGMKTWTSTGIALPSRRSVAKENGFYEHPTLKTFIESAEFAQPFQIRFSERGFVEAGTAMQKIFLKNEDPKEVMTNFAKRIEKYKLID